MLTIFFDSLPHSVAFCCYYFSSLSFAKYWKCFVDVDLLCFCFSCIMSSKATHNCLVLLYLSSKRVEIYTLLQLIQLHHHLIVVLTLFIIYDVIKYDEKKSSSLIIKMTPEAWKVEKKIIPTEVFILFDYFLVCFLVQFIRKNNFLELPPHVFWSDQNRFVVSSLFSFLF